MNVVQIASQLAGGMGVSLEIFFLTLLFALPLGLLLSFGRMSRYGIVRNLAKIYISIMRGTPLMLQLMVVNFGPYYLFGVRIQSSYRFTAVIIGFALNYAAYFGLVFQNFNLFPHYSVLKNIVDAPIHVQKRKKEEVYEEARSLLKKMGLSSKEKDYPCQLSGGQKQRVSIARALARNPKILFFDEPTSALDPELTGEILSVLKELAAEHMTMAIVTHEMNFARNVADQIIFLESGNIVVEGTPDEVFHLDNERIQEFIGKF